MPDTRKLLRLADTPVLVQQLRLITGNMRSSFWPAMLLVLLVRFTWLDDSNAHAMNLWCGLKLLVQLNVKFFIFRFDRLVDRPMSTQTAHRLVWWLLVNSMVGGILWGGLLWIAPQTATLGQSSLVLAVIAVVLGGSVSTVSALLPICLAFIVPLVVVMLLNAELRSIAQSPLVLVGCALYVMTLLDQAFKGASASKASIQLRFENVALLEGLRRESEAVQRARRDAEAASVAKSKVLAAASHDLRQPVHAQGLFLELLARTELTRQQRELLACASESVTASANMLGTLFDFARIEGGAVDPRLQVFAIQPLLNKIEREFAPQADAAGLNFRGRESPLVVHSDPALVELILRNLVSNAIRYTLRGGLLVSCRRRHGCAVLEVWDTGIGIAQSHQREVFREFHQLDNPDRDRRKGFGLGLAIVEGLSRTLGHDLSVRSRPQRGSVFRLTLPIATSPPLPDPSIGASLYKQLLGARVLLIDGDESIRSGMLQLLESWGCECDGCESIDEAIGLATRRAPDLVITDFRLRGQRSGMDAIVELRALLGDRFGALLITGDTDPDRSKEAAGHGIPLLHKPVSPSQLYRTLVAALP